MIVAYKIGVVSFVLFLMAAAACDLFDLRADSSAGRVLESVGTFSFWVSVISVASCFLWIPVTL